jgi:CheY-like chemotaxis protein
LSSFSRKKLAFLRYIDTTFLDNNNRDYQNLVIFAKYLVYPNFWRIFTAIFKEWQRIAAFDRVVTEKIYMQILHITDTNFPVSVTGEQTLPKEVLSKTTAEIGKEINDRYADIDLFIICAEVLVKDKNRSDFAGIELLKFIRLYGINKHCVLYSFLSREQLMLCNARHSIIFSKGVSFYRLPEFLGEIGNLDLNKLSKNTSERTELLPYFRAEYDPANSHFETNKFGIWQLAQVQMAVENKLSDTAIKEFFKDIKRVACYLDSYNGLLTLFINNNDINKIHQTLSESIARRGEQHPKIIFVDDMADDGWAAILQRMIYGQNDENFISVIPAKNESPEQIVERIWEKATDARLLILDLRLHDERGQIFPSDISGFKVLKELQKKYPPFPILIVTASNKIWSMKEAFTYGAVAFWMKGGVNSEANEQSSIESYLRLMHLIYSLTENYDFFKILSKLKKCVNTIKNSESKFWWEEVFWRETGTYTIKKADEKGDKTRRISKTYPKSKDSIVNILENSLSIIESKLIKELLTGYLLNFESLYCPFIAYLSYALEEIHEEEATDVAGVGALAQSQLLPNFYTRYKVLDLIHTRNDAVHHNRTIKKKDFEDFINRLVGYLSVDYATYKTYPHADEIKDNPDLSFIRKNLVNKKEVEVKVIEHDNKGKVTFYIDKNETAFIYSKKKDGTAIIPNPQKIIEGSVIKIKKNPRDYCTKQERSDNGLIYNRYTFNPLLIFVEVVSY